LMYVKALLNGNRPMAWTVRLHSACPSWFASEIACDARVILFATVIALAAEVALPPQQHVCLQSKPTRTTTNIRPDLPQAMP
jgi:hypothetical protein